MLGVESLLDLQDREDREVKHVAFLIEATKTSDIDSEQKKSMIGSLNWLKKYSISQSLKIAAERYLPDKMYDGMPSSKFIGKCYDVRSKLVHNGFVDSEKINLGTLTAKLKVYLADMLIAIHDIQST